MEFVLAACVKGTPVKTAGSDSDVTNGLKWFEASQNATHPLEKEGNRQKNKQKGKKWTE